MATQLNPRIIPQKTSFLELHAAQVLVGGGGGRADIRPLSLLQEEGGRYRAPQLNARITL